MSQYQVDVCYFDNWLTQDSLHQQVYWCRRSEGLQQHKQPVLARLFCVLRVGVVKCQDVVYKWLTKGKFVWTNVLEEKLWHRTGDLLSMNPPWYIVGLVGEVFEARKGWRKKDEEVVWLWHQCLMVVRDAQLLYDDDYDNALRCRIHCLPNKTITLNTWADVLR